MGGEGWVLLLFTALLWGGTNPFLKRGVEGLSSVDKKFSSSFLQMAYELFWLLTRWRYTLPFAINQLGSVLFFYCLASLEVSVASPVVNGLTFLVTALVSGLIGEKPLTKRSLQGTVLVAIGCFLMTK